ncbi:hypothetical protein FB451DRAFT_1551058 [Mycena latifolia]|nr:hypothetical protein FB451DRAFT_1551058 [Mycena latifolia]
MSPSSTTPPPTFGDEVFWRIFSLFWLFVPTFANYVVAVYEYHQPEGTPVDWVWASVGGAISIVVTIILCVALAAGEVLSARIQLVSVTAVCFTAAARFPEFLELGIWLIPLTCVFHLGILPWVWDALLTDFGMPGRVFVPASKKAAQGCSQAQPPAHPQVNSEEGLPLYSTHVTPPEMSQTANQAENEETIIDAAPAPAGDWPFYSTHVDAPTVVASGVPENQTENGRVTPPANVAVVSV